MTDHALDRAQLAEAVGNDISDMAHFWMRLGFRQPDRPDRHTSRDAFLAGKPQTSLRQCDN